MAGVPSTSNNNNSTLAKKRYANYGQAPSSVSERAPPQAPFVYCANCCVTIPRGEKRKLAFCNKLQIKKGNKVTVMEALQTIFFTYNSPDCPPLSPLIGKHGTEDGRYICQDCANSLLCCYVNLQKFKQRMKHGSYIDTRLRTRIEKIPLKKTRVKKAKKKKIKIEPTEAAITGESQSQELTGDFSQSQSEKVEEPSAEGVQNLVLVKKTILPVRPLTPPPPELSKIPIHRNPKNPEKLLTFAGMTEVIFQSNRQTEVFYNYIKTTISKEVRKLARNSVYFRGPQVLTKEQDLFPEEELIVKELKSTAPLFYKVLIGAMANNSRTTIPQFSPEFRSALAIILHNRNKKALRYQKYIAVQILKNKNNVTKMADTLSRHGLCCSWKTLLRLLRTLEQNDIVIQEDEVGPLEENNDSNASDSDCEDSSDETETGHTTNPDFLAVKIKVEEGEQSEGEETSSVINILSSSSAEVDCGLQLEQAIKTEALSPPCSPPAAKRLKGQSEGEQEILWTDLLEELE